MIRMSDRARLMHEDLLDDSEDGGKIRFAPSTVQKMPSPVGENSNTSAYSGESYQSSRSSGRVGGYDGQNPQEQERYSWFVLLLTTISAIGGFLFGYDTGVVSGAMLLIKKDFDLSDWQEEVVVSITIASAVVAAVAGGPGMERFGRKPSILLAAVIFTVGAVLLAAARSYDELVIGRLVIGLGIGLASLTTPVYIAEAAPSKVRGTLVTLNTLFITVGQVVAGVVDGLFANVDGGWRWMLGLSGIPSLLMTVGFLILPESPRWLVSCGRRREALSVLQRIRGSADVHSELEEMVHSVTDDSGGLRKSVTARGLLEDPRIRRALVLGCGLQFLQQLSGINTVMYYSATIFSMAGFSDEASIWLAAVTAAAQSAGVCLGLYFVEVCGRRQLALTSLGLVVCALVSLGAGFYLYEDEENIVALYTSSSSTNTYGWLVAGAMMAYLFTFGIGMSSVPWTVNAEIYPTHARSLGTSASTTTSWLGNVLVSATFLSLADDKVLGRPGAFWLYASIGVAGWFWLFRGMPETKGLSLEEIEQLFEREGDPPRPGDSPGGPTSSLTDVTRHNGDFAMLNGMPGGSPEGVLDTNSWAGARNNATMT